MPKGVYQRFKTIGDRELRHYSKHYVRRVTYEINPNNDNVRTLKQLFQKHIDSTNFQKGKPTVEFDGDTLIYKYKGKPPIYYDMKKGTFKVSSEDSKKHGKITCSNQAHYALENIKKSADGITTPTGEKPYITCKWRKRKRRPKVPYEPDAYSWNLWEERP